MYVYIVVYYIYLPGLLEISVRMEILGCAYVHKTYIYIASVKVIYTSIYYQQQHLLCLVL